MANSAKHNLLIIKTSTINILALIVPLILLSTLILMQPLFSSANDIINDVNDEEYILDDNPIVPNSSRSRSRFLGSYKVMKKGTHCDPVRYNICNGVSANKGTSLLYCCKTHCRNVLGDRNNCGRCGRKCKFGERCCHGSCTNVLYNVNHCGQCDNKCQRGVGCDNGYCGYA